MFYISLILHCILLIEAYWLFQKRLRRKSLYLSLINLLTMLFNLIFLSSTLNKTDSSIVYLESLLSSKPFLMMAWFMVNLLLFIFVILIMNDAKKKRRKNKILEWLIYLLITLNILYFICIFLDQIAQWLILLFFIWMTMICLKKYLKTEKTYYLAYIFLIFIVIFYSYFTDIGAARLEIALKGYPIEAYETGFEELKYYKEKNVRKYMPIERITMQDSEIGLIEVKNVMFIKIASSNKL